MPQTKRKPQAAAYRVGDIAACLDGKCRGAYCPCLCHTSLKLTHDQIRKPGARIDRASHLRKEQGR
jgi:hypothetical protein